MEVAANIFKFDTGPFNWYLIRENGRFTLVDAGFPGHYRAFTEGIKSLGHSAKDLEAIVLTHAHADHIGFAERLRKETGVPVYVHQADAKMAARPLQVPWLGLISNAWRPYTAFMLGTATVKGIFTLPHLTKTVSVKNGDVLDVPGRPHVLHTPGHTPGEIVLWMPEKKVLISGDTLVTRNLFTGKLGQPQLASPILNSDYKTARRSLDLLQELGRATMLPGHGDPWQGEMREAVALALENSKK
ncbi:MAG: MBL fold metallo-hydrolase [Saprospiraceae bacterium]|nr:MBL fold metallo-hydrolase [Saprospiraceae bacterium]